MLEFSMNENACFFFAFFAFCFGEVGKGQLAEGVEKRVCTFSIETEQFSERALMEIDSQNLFMCLDQWSAN